jgi:hypothetical protein
MSEIVKAREMIQASRHLLDLAVSLMTREPAVKKAPAKRIKITEAIRTQVKALAAEGKTNHQIAEIVGLRNGGRVSEILNGKR